MLYTKGCRFSDTPSRLVRIQGSQLCRTGAGRETDTIRQTLAVPLLIANSPVTPFFGEMIMAADPVLKAALMACKARKNYFAFIAKDRRMGP